MAARLSLAMAMLGRRRNAAIRVAVTREYSSALCWEEIQGSALYMRKPKSNSQMEHQKLVPSKAASVNQIGAGGGEGFATHGKREKAIASASTLSTRAGVKWAFWGPL